MAIKKSTTVAASTRRDIQKQFDEQLAGQFLSARSALMTAILAIECQGRANQHVATNLRMHVLNSLDQIEKAVTGREVSL